MNSDKWMAIVIIAAVLCTTAVLIADMLTRSFL